MASQPKLVNKQFNSPIGLYSPQNIQEVLQRESQLLANGAVGIDFYHPENVASGNLKNSAVLRMLQEEENRQRNGLGPGGKRVAWPPPNESGADSPYVEQKAVSAKGGPQYPSPGLQQNNYQAPVQQSVSSNLPVNRPLKPLDVSTLSTAGSSPLSSPLLNQSPLGFRSSTPAKGWAPVQSPVASPGQQPSWPQSRPQQSPQLSQSSSQASWPQTRGSNQPQQVSNQTSHSQSDQHSRQQQTSTASTRYQTAHQSVSQQTFLGQQYLPSATTQYQSQQQYQTSSQQQYQAPQQHNQSLQNKYQTQQSQNQAQASSNQYQAPQNQYQTQQSLNQAQASPNQYQAPQSQYQTQQSLNQAQASLNQYQAPQNQYQTQQSLNQAQASQYQANQNQYQAPQQQYQPPKNQYQPALQQFQPPQQQPQSPQQYQASSQQYQYPQSSQPAAAPSQAVPRAAQPAAGRQVEPPPSTISLRSQAPVSQAPPPVITSQPATATLRGGKHLRGDLKWPPECVRRRWDEENRLQLEIANGPAFKPKRPNKDYTEFFEQHALNSTYPGYNVPPGTQFFRPL